MQQNSAARVVTPLGVVVIVLSVISIIAGLAAFVLVKPLGILINESIDMGITLSTPQVKLSSSDIAELRDVEHALSSLNKEELADVEAVISALADEDWQEVVLLTDLSNPENLQNLISAVASMSDRDLQRFAEMTDSMGDLEDMKQARDWAASLTPFQVERISETISSISASGLEGFVSGVAMTLLQVLIFIFLISAFITLIAGILSTKNAYHPEKLGAAFAWTVVACVLALFSLRLITFILLVVLAIYVSKARKEIPQA